MSQEAIHHVVHVTCPIKERTCGDGCRAHVGSKAFSDTYVHHNIAAYYFHRRVDGVHHHKILTHEGIWRFEKAVSLTHGVA
jgi:hypothetical protein